MLTRRSTFIVMPKACIEIYKNAFNCIFLINQCFLYCYIAENSVNAINTIPL